MYVVLVFIATLVAMNVVLFQFNMGYEKKRNKHD